jgi:hypothetical protein
MQLIPPAERWTDEALFTEAADVLHHLILDARFAAVPGRTQPGPSVYALTDLAHNIAHSVGRAATVGFRAAGVGGLSWVREYARHSALPTWLAERERAWPTDIPDHWSMP